MLLLRIFLRVLLVVAVAASTTADSSLKQSKLCTLRKALNGTSKVSKAFGSVREPLSASRSDLSGFLLELAFLLVIGREGVQLRPSPTDFFSIYAAGCEALLYKLLNGNL